MWNLDTFTTILKKIDANFRHFDGQIPGQSVYEFWIDANLNLVH